MRRRYTILGLTGVLAVALAVPALGGPSNPIATGAASAKTVATKALKKAKAANSAAAAAQATANQALSTANSAKTDAAAAQADATAAQADAATVTDDELGLTFPTGADTSANTAGLDTATAVADCGTKQSLGAMGFVSAEDVAITGLFLFYEPVATAAELDNTGAAFTLNAQGTCINE